MNMTLAPPVPTPSVPPAGSPVRATAIEEARHTSSHHEHGHLPFDGRPEPRRRRFLRPKVPETKGQSLEAIEREMTS
jgi:hypothetical protein